MELQTTTTTTTFNLKKKNNFLVYHRHQQIQLSSCHLSYQLLSLVLHHHHHHHHHHLVPLELEPELEQEQKEAEKLAQFRPFVNSATPDPSVVFIGERAQHRPARTDEKRELLDTLTEGLRPRPVPDSSMAEAAE